MSLDGAIAGEHAERTKNHTFALNDLANSALLTQLIGPQSTLWKRAYEPFRAVLKSTSVERSGTTYARCQQARDALGRVTPTEQVTSGWSRFSPGGSAR